MKEVEETEKRCKEIGRRRTEGWTEGRTDRDSLGDRGDGFKGTGGTRTLFGEKGMDGVRDEA